MCYNVHLRYGEMYAGWIYFCEFCLYVFSLSLYFELFFFNVFFGEMSVVGPRPHMVSVANIYAAKVDKFMVRHFVKPGITGLAQTKGYRGEVETDEDIINRVKYDIFYIENWSVLLDIKIIFITVFNTLRGDKKAY